MARFYVLMLGISSSLSSLASSCVPGCICDNTTVQCTNVLSFLPHSLEQRTTHLIIHSSFLGPNLDISFSSLMNLELLDLSGNNIHTISESVLRFLRRLKRLDLSRNHLVRFDDFVFKHLRNLEELDLSFNDFFVIPDVPFRFLENLKLFNISFNKLEELKLGLRFQVMTKMQTLDFSGNSFHYIDAAAMEMTYSWRHDIPKSLNLSYCQIASIHPRAFRHLVGIRRLSLAGNTDLHPDNLTAVFNSSDLQQLTNLDLSNMNMSNITVIPQSLQDFPMTELILSNNSISEMPMTLRDYLRSLRVLYVDKNKLESLDQSITEIASLVVLDLSHNKISEIHDSFRTFLTKLKVLNLSNNQLVSNTLDVSNCEDLEMLDVSNNEISNFTTPANLNKLRVLNLAGNRIDTTAPLSGLSSLEEFDISGNKLTHLTMFLFVNSPKIKFANFSNNQIVKANHQTFRPNSPLVIDLSNNELRKLWNMGWIGTYSIDIHGNKLVAIDDQAFYALSSLRYLNLGHNNLSYLPPDAFEYLTNVSELMLNNNKLHSEADIFSALRPLYRLTRIDLGHNCITTLKLRTFSNAKTITSIKANDNKIVNINPAIFNDLLFLKEVDLSHNDFRCDCSLLGLRNWARETSITLINKLLNESYACRGPSARTGIPLWRFDVGKFECDQTLLLIIIFSSVGGVAMVIGSIAAVVCHFFYKWKKSRSYGIKRASIDYHPINSLPMKNDNILHRKQRINGIVSNGVIPRGSKSSSDLEVEMLLKAHQKESIMREKRSKRLPRQTKDTFKPSQVRKKERQKRHVKPSQSLSALDKDAISKYMKGIRESRYPNLHHSHSDADLLQNKPIALPKHMADIVRLPNTNYIDRKTQRAAHAYTLPYMRRPAGPRSRPGYRREVIRRPPEEWYDPNYGSRGYRLVDPRRTSPQVHPGYFTVGGRMSNGQLGYRAEWI